MSLHSTDVAVVNAGSELHVYYQGDDSKIYEVKSKDGKAWTKSSKSVAESVSPNGSPITAYYVQHDGGYEKKPTIHVLYIDGQGHLQEKVKQLSKGDEWTSTQLPDNIAKAPIATTRLSSGVCHDTSAGAHQWAFFVITDQTSGLTEVAEIRSGSESSFKWVYRKILPQDPAAALPGTSIATNLTNPTTHLFFQDHHGDIVYYSGGYEHWNKEAVLITKDKVQINSPLAAAASSTENKPHLFYADAGPKFAIQDHVVDGSTIKVADFVPGTRFGAAVFDGKVYLVHKALLAPTALSSSVFDGKAWAAGGVVVA